MTWLMRMSRWSRNPPSMGRVKLLLALIAVVVIIITLEKTGYWPEWAQMERMRRQIPRP